MQTSTDIDQASAAVTIRRLTGADRRALAALAGRESKPLPAGPMLGAEVGGRIVVATSLTTGETLADPFEPTAELRAVLELRAAQLLRQPPRKRGLRISLRSRPRAALAGSPPGAGGRLLSLDSR